MGGRQSFKTLFKEGKIKTTNITDNEIDQLNGRTFASVAGRAKGKIAYLAASLRSRVQIPSSLGGNGDARGTDNFEALPRIPRVASNFRQEMRPFTRSPRNVRHLEYIPCSYNGINDEAGKKEVDRFTWTGEKTASAGIENKALNPIRSSIQIRNSIDVLISQFPAPPTDTLPSDTLIFSNSYPCEVQISAQASEMPAIPATGKQDAAVSREEEISDPVKSVLIDATDSAQAVIGHLNLMHITRQAVHQALTAVAAQQALLDLADAYGAGPTGPSAFKHQGSGKSELTATRAIV